MSTGHAYLDMLLVMLLPLAVRHFLPILSDWVTRLFTWERNTKDVVFERQVRAQRVGAWCGSTGWHSIRCQHQAHPLLMLSLCFVD